MFKARTSKDEDKNVESDIKEFVKQFIQVIKGMVDGKKKELMKLNKKTFESTYSRSKIQ